MNRGAALLVLFTAALFEATGDALIRLALHRSGTGIRALLFMAGACVLFAYGWTVNAVQWDFGRLLGLYVVFFFLIAQVLSWGLFGQPPSRAIVIGGSLIVVGGLVIALGE